jgi:small subunit ribosomal protein S13
MARISGIDLPAEKRIEIGLTYIHGIGRPTADKILADLKIDPSTRCKALSDEDGKKIKDYCDKNDILLEGDLRKKVGLEIKALTEIGSYRGVRHRQHRPLRGQHTHSNCRTHKGPRNGGKKK